MRDVTDHLDMTEFVRSGDTVLWSQGAAEPLTLIDRLLAQRHEIGPFTVFMAGSYSGAARPEHADTVRFLGLGAVGANRHLCDAGAMRVIPCNFSALPRMIADGALRVDVVLAQLSDRHPDGETGFSFGAANGYLDAAMSRARTVLAEFNEAAPWTYARQPVNARVDAYVRTATPLVEVPTRPATATDEVIAAHIAELIDDGSVLQFGIGGIPAAVAAKLADHRRLGIHTGVLGDHLRHLIDIGAVDNSAKTLDRGVTIAGALTGTRDLYSWAHHNPAVRLEPVDYTHAQAVLSRLDNLVAINSALEVDLTGQVSSEVAGRRYRGTIGGLADFARGARAAEGGRSIIALPSRTGRDGTRPTIVPVCTSGFVSLGRADADIVVTEYGRACLRGLPLDQRIGRMISIAHPDDRETLERDAAAIAGR